MVHPAMKIAAIVILLTTAASASDNAEEARWLVKESLWGTLSWLEDETASAMVTSFGETDGRLFFYLPVNIPQFKAALTLSEAALDTSQFEGAKCGPDGDLDPEDPRCAKLTISGTMKPVDDDKYKFGLDTLYAKHPQMESWPADHGFVVYEMHIDDLWMIANYGGGGSFSATDFLASDPQQHAGKFPKRRTVEAGTAKRTTVPGSTRPNFGDDAAGHARWLVAKSLWTTVTTLSSREEGQAFGNIRSIVDGGCFLEGSGYPVFYLPTPDPTNIDIEADDKNNIVLSFTEAALPQLVGDDGKACGGNDAEDPTCAKISLTGHAVLVKDEQLEEVKTAFGLQHPRASWLSKGGAHTGGNFYTIHIESMQFFRNYGGLAKLSVEHFTNWVPDASKFVGEKLCPVSDSTAEALDDPGGCYPGAPTHQCGCAADSCSKQLCEAKGHTWSSGCPICDPKECDVPMEHDTHSHSYGEHSTEHHHGMGGDSSMAYQHNMENSETDEGSKFTMSSFLLGAAFGFLLWGPAITLLVYHRSCGAGQKEEVPQDEW